MTLSHSDSTLGAFYRRLCTRMDKSRASTATATATATAQKFARMVSFMRTRDEAFVDREQQRYDKQQRQRSVVDLKRRAAALRFPINPMEAAA